MISTPDENEAVSVDACNLVGDAIVQVTNLEKSYGAFSVFGRRRVDALRGVSIQAHAGDVFGLLGPNGAGKTTLIKILLGVVRPTRGSAALFGKSVGTTAARQRVGYLPESLRIDKHHSARTALRYYGRLSRMDSKQIAIRTDELLELVGLRGRDRESVKQFSKGMYQRLGLAQALMHNPDLLVLDEPTDGLDPVGRSEVRRVIERLSESGKTIFLNSHILQEVELVCTRVAILDKGKILRAGRIDELARQVGNEKVILDLQVPQGDDELLNRCLGFDQGHDFEVSELAPAVTDQQPTHRVTIEVPSQSTVDKIVDRLRAQGVSILRLDVERTTLEDTFIDLVNKEEPDS